VERPLYLPLIRQGQGTPPTPEPPQPPQQAGTARYVRYYWLDRRFEDLVNQGEIFEHVAYARGYNAFAGQPHSTTVLAFGRQLEAGRTLSDGTLVNEWSVLLVGEGTLSQRTKTNDWVAGAVANFVRGYVANPAHTTDRKVTIAVGTSNGNYAWDCGNVGSGSVDEGDFWETAGQEWRKVIRDINNRLTPSQRDRVTIVGANDIESWFGEGDYIETEDDNGNLLNPPEQAWIGCAEGTLKWFDGWEAESGLLPPPDVINFGSNTYDEVFGVDTGETFFIGEGEVRARFDFGDQWTRDDLLEVTGNHPTRRRWYIRMYPQIYCSRQESSWVALTEWAIANEDIPYTYFDGVTSEDAGSGLCGDAGLTWPQSWTTLRDALLSSPEVDMDEVGFRLRQSVTSFYHSQLSIDEP
jgi:hypothetical protein